MSVSTAQKTTDALTAATKACDLGNSLSCVLKASFLYGLKKDERAAAETFANTCANRKFGIACYMASLHAEKVQKNQKAAAEFLKKACDLGFKYRCDLGQNPYIPDHPAARSL